MKKERKRFIERRGILLILIGVFVGIVLFAGGSKGLEATDSPEFCSSCHIMESAHDSFMDSNHATLSCNDCHVPHDNVVSKLWYKGKAGLGHIYYNTLGTEKIPDVLHATQSTEDVVNDNCMRCHEPAMENLEHPDVKDRGCISCHRQVPHGKGMYKPDDWFEPGNVDVKK